MNHRLKSQTMLLAFAMMHLKYLMYLKYLSLLGFGRKRETEELKLMEHVTCTPA